MTLFNHTGHRNGKNRAIHPPSISRPQRVVDAGKCGAKYDTVLLNFGDDLHSPEYLAINPMGKLPALKYGDTVITETAAIITFLADVFPKAQLAPALSDAKRGEYYRWLFYTVNSVSGFDGSRVSISDTTGHAQNAGLWQHGARHRYLRRPIAPTPIFAWRAISKL